MKKKSSIYRTTSKGRKRSRSYSKKFTKTKRSFKGFKKNIQKKIQVKGIRRRLDTKTELKQATSTVQDIIIRARGLAAGSLPSCPSQVVFATTGNDGGGQPFFVIPAAGTGANQRIGLKINLQFLLLTFTLQLNDLADATEGILIDDIPPFVRYRVMVVKRRTPVTTPTLDLPAGNYATNTPIDARLWDIQYDKVFTLGTGAPWQWRGTASLQEAGPSTLSPPKNFKFKIPLKQTVEYNNNLPGWAFNNDLFVCIVPDNLYSSGGVFPDYYSDKVILVRNIYYKVYWTDN
nr:MAG: capsid protein [Cressdnaviricota sp.]